MRTTMQWLKTGFIACGLALMAMVCATAQTPEVSQSVEAPDVLIGRVSNEVLDLLKKDQALRSGNVDRIMAVVNGKIMPHVNFTRMTAMAVGPAWRDATPEQKQQLQHELELLLVRTYAGALDQVNQDMRFDMKPFRGSPSDTDVTVNSEFRGAGNPVEVSYRLRREADGWKVYNVNVAGVWMVESYRSQFQPQLNAGGVQALIDALHERNQQNADAAK